MTTYPTCGECRRHIEEYRQAILEREAMRRERDDLRDQMQRANEAARQEVDYHAGKVDDLHAEVERLRHAIGLMTTAKPDMEMDAKDPVGMARQVVAEVERLRCERDELREQMQALRSSFDAACANMRAMERQRDELLELAERIALDLEYELRARYADDSGSGAIDIRHEARWERDMADVRALRALRKSIDEQA